MQALVLLISLVVPHALILRPSCLRRSRHWEVTPSSDPVGVPPHFEPVALALGAHGVIIGVVDEDDASEGAYGCPSVEVAVRGVVGAKKGEYRRVEEERVRKEESERVGWIGGC